MTQTNQGFKFTLTISHMDSIKPRKADTFKSKEGDEISYGYAVKFKSRNIDTVADEDFGEKDLEMTLEIEIACDTLEETIKLNNFLKKMKDENKNFMMDVFPSEKVVGGYSCKSILKGEAFMSLLSLPKKP